MYKIYLSLFLSYCLSVCPSLSISLSPNSHVQIYQSLNKKYNWQYAVMWPDVKGKYHVKFMCAFLVLDKVYRQKSFFFVSNKKTKHRRGTATRCENWPAVNMGLCKQRVYTSFQQTKYNFTFDKEIDYRRLSKNHN